MALELNSVEQGFLSSLSPNTAKSYREVLNTYENIITKGRGLNCTDFTAMMLKQCQTLQIQGLEIAAVLVAPQLGSYSFGHEAVAIGIQWIKPNIVFDPILPTSLGKTGYGQLNTMKFFTPRLEPDHWKNNNARQFINYHGCLLGDLDLSRPSVVLMNSQNYLGSGIIKQQYVSWV